MTGRLEGRRALVSGAARGIGRAIAERFLREGARVVISDIADGSAAAGELSALGEARFVRADVAKATDCTGLVEETVAALSGLDILVNNAGISFGAPFLDLSEEDFDRVLGVNLKGAFLLSQAAARVMAKAVDGGGRAGSIVNMSSINAQVSIPEQVAYSVSKGGINQLTRSTALALAPWGIRVNAIGPGSIDTDMLATVNADAGARNRMLSRTPLGRIGTVDEIASVAAFLASDDAAYVTGETIYVDGGRLALNYTVPVKGS
ncbi:MAG: dehydrogenase [Mesorhizobium amorphae]|nr:MAG: dehydrogenase [Mesorhizobium amorphae]